MDVRPLTTRKRPWNCHRVERNRTVRHSPARPGRQSPQDVGSETKQGSSPTLLGTPATEEVGPKPFFSGVGTAGHGRDAWDRRNGRDDSTTHSRRVTTPSSYTHLLHRLPAVSALHDRSRVSQCSETSRYVPAEPHPAGDTCRTATHRRRPRGLLRYPSTRVDDAEPPDTDQVHRETVTSTPTAESKTQVGNHQGWK